MKIQQQLVRLFLVVISLVIFCSSQSLIALADSIHKPLIVAQSDTSENTSAIWSVASSDKDSSASYCDNTDAPNLPDKLIEKLGTVNFPVTTNNEEARKFFHQGLILFYGFNGEEAIRFFRKAAALDPNMAMAYYGMALTPGTNINIVIDKKCQEYAYEQIQNARKLMSNASPMEQALIEALSFRYSNGAEPQLIPLAVAYKNAMAKVYEQYPEQPDVISIYVDSLMDLYPWRLWNADGTVATPVTKEVVSILEEGLKDFPNHIGINHYYIHAIEGSAEPQKALASAHKLGKLAPNAGHLVHMPSHIYARIGDYQQAAKSNEDAINVDQPYADRCQNLSSSDCGPIYASSYYTHNLLFKAVSYAMSGQSQKAIETAHKVEERVPHYLNKRPILEHFLPSKILMLERFRRWDEIIQYSEPQVEASTAIKAFWHWAKAMAYLGKQDLEAAKKEKVLFHQAARNTSYDVPWKSSKARDILEVAAWELDAKIAYSQGKLDDAIDMLEKAVYLQERLAYTEPIPWPPVREALGAVLYAQGRYQEAQQVFEEDLAIYSGKADRRTNPQNGRSLFGLYNSLLKQRKVPEAQRIKKQFDKVWKYADVELQMSDLF